MADGTAVIEAGVGVRAGVTATGAGNVRVAEGTTVMEGGVEVVKGVADASVGAAVVAMAGATAAVGNPAAGAPAADF